MSTTAKPPAVVERSANQQLAPAGLSPQDWQQLTATNIKTPADLADRVRAIQQHAFILSPVTATGSIAPGYEIMPIVVVIDPSVDAESGRGADVYHQPAIHKTRKIGERQFEPLEVSLNAQALGRILNHAGVNAHPSRWQHDGVVVPNLWVCETDGHFLDFTGQVRVLPAGLGSLDARDGSADIGEWTAEEWARRVSIADQQREKTPRDQQWKVKPEPINGWTYDRVLQVRRFGRQLALTKSLNGLARRLGIRQSYLIEELRRKPFVILRPMWIPDQSNPRVQEMIAAANLGATHLLYGGAHAAAVSAPVSHSAGEMGGTLQGEVVSEPMNTAPPPEDSEAFEETEAAPGPSRPPVYVITDVRRRGKGAEMQFFIVAQPPEGEPVTLFTTDTAMARACQAAKKDGLPRELATEAVSVQGQTYRQLLEMTAAGGLKL